MKTYTLILLLVLISACTGKDTDATEMNLSVTSNAHTSETVKNGYEYLINFLNNNDLNFYEDDNMITFKIDGRLFVTLKEANSPMLSISHVVNVQNIPRSVLLETCNLMNKKTPFTKFYINFNSSILACSYEFAPNDTDSTSHSNFFNILYNLTQRGDEFIAQTEE